MACYSFTVKPLCLELFLHYSSAYLYLALFTSEQTQKAAEATVL